MQTGVYFGLSTTGTGMTYLSDFSVLPNRWVHLAGTYDGTTMKLYVDGDLMNSSTRQLARSRMPIAGISWAVTSDDDEDFRIRGVWTKCVWNVAQPDRHSDEYVPPADRFQKRVSSITGPWTRAAAQCSTTTGRSQRDAGGSAFWLQTGPPILPGLDSVLLDQRCNTRERLAAGMDPDGGALTYSTVTQPAHGNLPSRNASTGAFTHHAKPQLQRYGQLHLSGHRCPDPDR